MSKSNLSQKIPPNTVVLHCVGPGKTLPHISPFVLKLQTYMRMADIPYQVDTKKPTGSNGKMPWISLNGKNLTDSQLIIEFLNNEFKKNLWPDDVTQEQKSTARLIRIALEEHCYWGLVQWRWIDSVDSLPSLQEIPSFKFKIAKLIVPGRIKKTLHEQGLGRFKKSDAVQMICQDIRDVSNLLGKKKFILGPEPCEEDAAIFGILAQCVWACPGSPYEKLISEELPNIGAYCTRMKEKYWTDWNSCLSSRGKSNQS